jgi:putative membrane protein insertion efficiency factor
MKVLQVSTRLFTMVIQGICLAGLYLYRYTLSPILHLMAPGGGCRFYPTCSEYAIEAVKTHGPLTGTWLAVKRLSKCHPWGPHGFDPVPHSCSCTAKTDHQHPSPLTHNRAPSGDQS